MIPQVDLDRAIARWKMRQAGGEVPVAHVDEEVTGRAGRVQNAATVQGDLPEAVAEGVDEGVPQELETMGSSGLIEINSAAHGKPTG